jgi:hypothetical protein
MTRHDEALYDDVAALAVGALPDAEAGALEQHIAACAKCQAEYRAARAGFDVALVAAEAAGEMLPAPRAQALRARVLTAARAVRAPRASGYSAVVARDALIPYAPGIEWAVVEQQGITLIYWVFTPPACGEFPAESHEQTQSGFVVEGAMHMDFAGDRSSMDFPQGAFYTVSPGTVHAASFPTRTVLVDTYAPNHREYERAYREGAARRAGLSAATPSPG